MKPLRLHEFHACRKARFIEVNGQEAVAHYGDSLAEYRALRERAALLDLSFRSRLCLTGTERKRFLHGQITNEVNQLSVGEGCYAALITAKGRMLSDLNVFVLENEILLDFEPGLSSSVAERLEKHIIADDVQVVEVAPHYGLLSVQGPGAAQTLRRSGLDLEIPGRAMSHVCRKDEALGEIYLMNQPRLATSGFDLFVPTAALESLAEKLLAAVTVGGGRPCGWEAVELARIEAGIPRFGADMDESNLPPEAGLESRAISYTKGCYIGQEVISRIRTYGRVAKALRRLRLAGELPELPRKGDKLLKDGKEVGFITSAILSPALGAGIALAYVRREANQVGTELTLKTAAGETSATINAGARQ